MVSRDLTCKETMPPLDDGDNVMEMRRVRNAMFSNGTATTSNRFGSAATPNPNSGPTTFSSRGPSAAAHLVVDSNSQQQQLHHTTTVRDVVTRHIRNSKLNSEAHLVGYPKLGGILSSISETLSSTPSRQQDALLVLNRHTINSQNTNGCMLTLTAADGGHRYDDGSGGSGGFDDKARHGLLLSPSSTSSNSSATPPTSINHQSVPIRSPSSCNNHNSYPPQITTTRHIISSAPTTISDLGGGPTTTYYVRSPAIGASSSTFITPSSSLIDQHNNHDHHHTLSNSTTTTNNNKTTHWAMHPPLYEQQQQPHLRVQSPQKMVGNVLMGSRKSPPSAVVGQYKSSTNDQQMMVPTTLYQPAPGTPPMHHRQSPQQHTSPRPTILRGNTSLRRLADRDRPASVCGGQNGITDPYDNGMGPGGGVGGGVDEMYGGDESPRKRQRKQQFDSSQLMHDKLRMEVMPDQRLLQSASAGPSLPDWRIPGSGTEIATAINSSSMTAHQQQVLFHQTDPSVSLGAVVTVSAKSGGGGPKRSGGRTASGNDHHGQPKKRGRPKMNCRTQQLPFAITANNGATQGEAGNDQQLLLNNNNNHYPDGVIGVSGTILLPTGNNIDNNNVMPQSTLVSKPMMVDVDSILQNNVLKKRKYRRRVPPVVDPLIGEPLEAIKKVRKKGSGRKSKKDLAMEVAQQQQNHLIVLGSPVAATASSSFGGPSSSLMMVESAEERDVINMLCQFKSDQEQYRALAAAAISAERSSNADEQKGITKKATNPSELLCSDRPSLSSAGALFTTQLPLLTDLNELNELRPLLRRCERGLNSTDNCHLTESYDEIVNFLNSIAHHSANADQLSKLGGIFAFDPTKQLDDQMIDRLSAEVRCPVFDSYEHFRNSTNSLRLLPLACAYFDASQRLLDSLRTSLLGVSLYQILQKQILQKQQNQNVDNTADSHPPNLVSLSTLDSSTLSRKEEEEDEEREEQLMRAFFKGLISEFVHKNDQRGQNKEEDKDNNHQKEQQLEEKFMAQLDVAQCLNSLLDSVERNKLVHLNRPNLTMEEGDGQKPEFSFSRPNYHADELDTIKNDNKDSPIRIDVKRFMAATNLPDNLCQLLLSRRRPKIEKTVKLQKGTTTKKEGKKRKRRRDEGKDNLMWKKEKEEEKEERMMIKEEKEVEEEEEAEEHEPSMERINQSEQLLRELDRLREQSMAEYTLLEMAGRLLEKIANRRSPAEAQHALLDPPRQEAATIGNSSSERRRTRNPHKSRQFAFRPSFQLLDELFKDIPKLKLETKGMDADNGMLSNPALTRRPAPEYPPSSSSNNNSSSEFVLPVSRKQSHSQKDNRNGGEGGGEMTQLLRVDLEQQLANGSHIAVKSRAHLRHKYPQEEEVGGDVAMDGDPGPSCSSASATKAPLSSDLFEPALKFRFPSTTTKAQTEFLKARLRELREICGTTLGLTRARAALTAECVESVRELLEEKQAEGTRGKKGIMRTDSEEMKKMTPSKKQHQRMASLEEEEPDEMIMMEDGGRGRGGRASSSSSQQQQQILKRAAHRKALTQLIQHSSNSRSVSVLSSRAASRDRSVEAKTTR